MRFISDLISKYIKKRKQEDAGEQLHTWSGNITRKVPVGECPFVVFDTELSGLQTRRDSIISIGAVKMTGGAIHISKEFYRLIKPQVELSKENVEIHGITPDELKRAEDLEAVLPEFLDFITDSVLVGHFINIDLNFMNKALRKRYKRKLPNPALDTHTLHEWLFENGTEFNKHFHGGSTKTDLFSVAQRYSITIDEAHNALTDSFITAQLFQKFLHFLHADGVHTLNDLLDIGRA